MTAFFETDNQNAILDTYWGGAAFTPAPPGTWYIALFTTMPAADGSGGVEATFSGYARAAVANDLTQWPAASGGAKSNANEIDYGTAGSGPETIVGFGFYSDPTSVLEADFYAAVDVTGGTVVVNNGAIVKFPAGAIDLTGCA